MGRDVQRLPWSVPLAPLRDAAEEVGIGAKQAAFGAVDLDRRTLMAPHIPRGAHRHVRALGELQRAIHHGGHLHVDRLPGQRLAGDGALRIADGGASAHARHRAQQVDELGDVIRPHVVDRSAAALVEEGRVGVPALHAVRKHRYRAADGPADASRVDRGAARLVRAAEESVRRAAHPQAFGGGSGEQRLCIREICR